MSGLIPARAKEIIEAATFRALLSYDSETGELTWRERPTAGLSGLALRGAKVWNTRFADTVAGSPNGRGYLKVDVKGRHYKAHRIAWLMMTTRWPVDQLDHVNGVRSDNRWVNLREVTHKENLRNKRAYANNSTGYPGVRRDCKRFEARILVDGKQHNLGRFDTPEEAHAVYLEAARKHGYDPLHGHHAEVRAERPLGLTVNAAAGA
jgi:hypothetical protein